MTEHFLKIGAAVAVPVVVSALDENTVRYKAVKTEKRYEFHNSYIWDKILFGHLLGFSIPALNVGQRLRK